jgi:Phytanoyl-CoA dioxygenase (PhyH)
VSGLDYRARYGVLHGCVPQAAVDAVLRMVWRHVLRFGVGQDRMAEFVQTNNWFPELRAEQPIQQLDGYLPPRWRTGQLCEPQLVLQFPDDTRDVYPLAPHVDESPAWAGGRPYLRIAAVALTPQLPENGGLYLWAHSSTDKPLAPLVLAPGDVLVMEPGLPHASGQNTTGSVRAAVYLRWLADG